MKAYKITWEIDIEANNPEDAAQQALIIQRDPESIANVFSVMEFPSTEIFNIDLND